jgi:NADH-quinone oxidoreductase subunit D
MNIGIVSKNNALDWGFSGVMLRGSGCLWDLRIIDGYELYNLFHFTIPVGKFGDCFDRYLVRLEEMRESLNIISQCLDFLFMFMTEDNNFFISIDYKIVPPMRSFMKFSMNL